MRDEEKFQTPIVAVLVLRDEGKFQTPIAAVLVLRDEGKIQTPIVAVLVLRDEGSVKRDYEMDHNWTPYFKETELNHHVQCKQVCAVSRCSL